MNLSSGRHGFLKWKIIDPLAVGLVPNWRFFCWLQTFYIRKLLFHWVASEYGSRYRSTRVDLKWFFLCVHLSVVQPIVLWSGLVNDLLISDLQIAIFFGFFGVSSIPFSAFTDTGVLNFNLFFDFGVLLSFSFSCTESGAGWTTASMSFVLGFLVATLKLASFWQTTQANFSIVCVY